MFKLHRKIRVLFVPGTKTARLSLVFAVLLVVGVSMATVPPHQAQAATNNQLNFQARLQTAGGGIVPDGYYNVQFKLYDISSGGSALWTESHIDTNGVTAGNDFRLRVKNGYLTVNLGSQTTFPGTINWDQDLWITMNVGGTAQTATPTYDGEMTPRLKLTGVPYAFRAGQLATGNGTLQSTLQILQPTVGNQVFQIQDQGAGGTYNLCIQTSTSCGFAAATGSASYIQNTTSPQTADFNITGSGTVGGDFTTNGAAINIGVSSIARTVIIGSAASGTQTVYLGSANSAANSVSIQGGSGTSAITLDVASGGSIKIGELLFNQNIQLGNSLGSTLVLLRAGTGGISIGANGIANTIQIGNTTGAVAQTVNVGNNAAASSTTTLNLGSSIGTSTTNINSGSSGINLNASNGNPVSIGSGGAFSLDSSNVDISTGGAITGVTGFTQASGATSLTNSAFTNISSGSSVFRTSTNSATAFQVQNANQTPIFGVDTVAPAANLLTNPNFEVNTTNWNAKSGGTITRITTPSSAIYYGVTAGQLVTSTATNSGTSYTQALTLGATYNFSFYARASTGTATGISFGYTNTGGDNNCSTGNSIPSTGFTRFSCSFTVTTTAGTALYVKQSGTSAQTIYLGAFQLLNTVTAPTPFSLGSTQLRGVVTSATSFQNTNDSTTAFQIQNATGSSNLFVADTLNDRIGIGLNNPTYKLDILTTVNNQQGLRVTTANQNVWGLMLNNATYGTTNATGFGIYQDDTGYSYLYNSNQPSITLAPNGNVGFNAVYMPAYAVDVGGDVNTSTQYRIGGNVALTNAALTFGAASAATIQSAATQALNITGNASSTLSTSAGDLNLQAAANLNIGNAGGTAINIGTNNAAHTIQIGNTGATGVQAITIGGTANASNSVTIQGGTGAGAINVQAGTNGQISIGTVTNNQITIGNSGASSPLTLGLSTATNTISIGSGNTNTGETQTINIGAGTPAGTGKAVVTVGNTTAASALNLRAGTGNINLNTVNTSGGTIVRSLTSDSSAAFQVQNSAGASLLTVDTIGNNINVLANNSPALSTWTTTTAMSVGVNTARVRGSAIAAHGYLYHVGGVDGIATTLATVQYAKLNADGTVGSWASTTALPDARKQFQLVEASGYLYVIGGRNASNTVMGTSYYAKLNADGTVGSWNTTTAINNGSSLRFGHSVVAYNGHIYLFGGFDQTIATVSTVYSAKINPDGKLGSWTTLTSLPTTLTNDNAIVANGYVYLTGGFNGSGYEDDVYYAKLNTDGTVGSWTAISAALNSTGGGDENFLTYVANGYLYVVGGDFGNRVVYAALNANGSLGSFATLTALPNSVTGEAAGASANGYFYVLGGSSLNDGSGTARSSVYYASTTRLKLGGSLDLVGYGGENLAEGGSGGTLTAGDTSVVGSLQVQGAASFSREVSIGGGLAVYGNTNLRATTNSTATFQVQNASSQNLLAVDTTNSALVLGVGEGATPASFTLRGAAAAGSNVAGANMFIDASNGTGSAGSGDLIFRTGQAFDQSPNFVNSSADESLASTTNSDSFDAGSGSNRLLLVSISTSSTTATRTVSSITYNGVALTSLSASNCAASGSNFCRGELWYLKNPASGTNTLSTTVSGTADISVGSAIFSNVDQTSTFGTPVTASGNGTTAGLTVTGTNTDQVVFDFLTTFGSSGDDTWPADQIFDINGGNNGAAGAYGPGVSPNTTTSWNITPTINWVERAVAINGVSTTATTVNPMTEVARITDGGSLEIAAGASLEVFGFAAFRGATEEVAAFNSTFPDTTLVIGSSDGNNGEKYITYRNIDTGSNAWMVGMDDDETFGWDYGTAGEISTRLMTLDQSGNLGIGDETPDQEFDVSGQIQFQLDGGAGDTTIGVCKNVADAAGVEAGTEFRDCNGTATDIAEFYPTQPGVEPGDVVSISDQTFTYQEEVNDLLTGAFTDTKKQTTVPVLRKGTAADTSKLLGIISTNPYQALGRAIIGQGASNPLPVALNGRVPVKVTNENGPIVPGDLLTASATTPGYAMKAIGAGVTIGTALTALEGDQGKIMAFAETGTYNPGAATSLMSQVSNLQGQVESLGDTINTTVVTTAELTVTGDAAIGGDLTVTGVAKLGGLELSGHFVTKGAAPAVELQPYAGVAQQPASSDSLVEHLAKVKLTGNDTGGKLVITIGSPAQNVQPGDLVKITFDKSFEIDPQVLINARGRDGVQVQFYINEITKDYFTIAALGTPQAGASYTLSYYAFQ